MKVCVLQPDYSTADVDYKNYDPPRDLTPLLPGDEVHHVFLNKLTTYRQLKALSRQGYNIFVNLCEGYLDWNVPSIDVPYYLDRLNLPYTGPDCRLYDPSKELMKYVAFTAGVPTPAAVVLNGPEDVALAARTLTFPLFVKPAHAGDSLGIDHRSCVHTEEELRAQAERLFHDFDQLLAEEYINGREFTVLVAAGDKECTVFAPVEYVFPEGYHYKTYALKTAELHPGANIPCMDATLAQLLKEPAAAIFNAFEGVGYARLDFRLDAGGRVFFLEINFTCSVFYPDGFEGSADHILKYDPAGASGFLQHIIREGICRHRKKSAGCAVRGNSIAGYGLFATRDLDCGEVIFEGEGRAQRLVTRRFAETNWPAGAMETFRRYAYPVSSDVFLLWDTDPEKWLPQNHSCSPNTAFDGLNVVACKAIPAGEELTLDYAAFLNEAMEPFACRCGAQGCRKWIAGTLGNSITTREAGLAAGQIVSKV